MSSTADQVPRRMSALSPADLLRLDQWAAPLTWMFPFGYGPYLWTGHRTGGGYGRTSWGGRQVYAHRLSFYLRTGRWPEGILRHLCNNPPCVLHVIEGTTQENVHDSLAAGTNYQAAKTHCPQGHEYTPENTYRDKSGRRCRACNRKRLKELKRRAREKVA